MADLTKLGASLELQCLSFGYPASTHRLEDISFSVGAGDICCLLGPNGAGKTTLLRCLLHHLTPAGGSRVTVCGQPTGRLSARALARLVAFSALAIAVMGRTPHLRFSTTPSAADRRLAQGCLDDLGIAHLQDRRFISLSGGEKQLVLLARALVQQAPVLILDEPTAALDYGNEVRLLQCIAGLAQAGRAILMTTHQPAHALWYGTTAVLMREGRIIAQGPLPPQSPATASPPCMALISAWPR
jgi:iron complex transport system ATP-binding protein